jgi:signal transduction histidine kinase
MSDRRDDFDPLPGLSEPPPPPAAPDRRAARELRRLEREQRRVERRVQGRVAGRGPGKKKAKNPDASAEERALREARHAANRKIGFLMHAVPYAAVCLFLLFVAGFRVAFIVAFAWGIGLACHFFAAMIAPGLRQRLVEEEVRHRLHADVHRERRSLEDEHSRRLEELSASIAHEIRNPITAAKSLVQQMGEDPSSGENVEYAGVALEELERVERSISHLLRFARDEEVELREVAIADVIESAIETFQDRVAQLGVEIRRDVDEAGAMRGDPEKLRRVILNLLSNALDAFQEAGTPGPRIEVTAGENLAGTDVWVRIRDNGPGIDRERLRRIFDPFYTSKASGTGLGLAISKKLVDAHGGSLEAHSEGGVGTEFVLTFPKQVGDGGPLR